MSSARMISTLGLDGAVAAPSAPNASAQPRRKFRSRRRGFMRGGVRFTDTAGSGGDGNENLISDFLAACACGLSAELAQPLEMALLEIGIDLRELRGDVVLLADVFFQIEELES